ncbi:collagen alpha-1(III) chain-like [Cervus canadensis]|uniref:collagen alpha-1(III) chain-like n=1 Tax=Cervus canadensis TaxID=1574408 RepID=UPI001C9E9D84|nr:collagen alpha-1(III) chain-like [Cervus canadensis]
MNLYSGRGRSRGFQGLAGQEQTAAPPGLRPASGRVSARRPERPPHLPRGPRPRRGVAPPPGHRPLPSTPAAASPQPGDGGRPHGGGGAPGAARRGFRAGRAAPPGPRGSPGRRGALGALGPETGGFRRLDLLGPSPRTRRSLRGSESSERADSVALQVPEVPSANRARPSPARRPNPRRCPRGRLCAETPP